MTAESSVKLHNKLWVNEADIRTIHSKDSNSAKSLVESKVVLEREFARTLLSGTAIAWYDFGLGWITGDSRLMQVVRHLHEIEKNVAAENIRNIDPDNSIAVIIGEKSTYHTPVQNDINWQLINMQYPYLFKSGVGADCYMIEDIDKITEYKCFLFLNTFSITPEQGKIINEKLKRDNKTLIFVYAPGIIEKGEIDKASMENITGLKFSMFEKSERINVVLNSELDALTKYLPLKFAYTSPAVINPIFYSTTGKVLGRISNLDVPGLVIQRNPEWTSIYSSSPVLPAALLRGIAENAGLNVYNANDSDVTYVGNRLFAVHTATGGPRIFKIPFKNAKVKELITGNEYTVVGSTFSVILHAPSTSIFFIFPTTNNLKGN